MLEDAISEAPDTLVGWAGPPPTGSAAMVRDPSTPLRDRTVPPRLIVFPDRYRSLNRELEDPRSYTLHAVG